MIKDILSSLMTVNFIYIGNPPYEDVYTPILSELFFLLAQNYFIIILFLQSKQKYGISKLNAQSSK